MVGAPHFLSMTTLRPLGPSVTLTASASRFTPRSSARRASSLNSKLLAMSTSAYVFGFGLPVTSHATAPARHGDRRELPPRGREPIRGDAGLAFAGPSRARPAMHDSLATSR